MARLQALLRRSSGTALTVLREGDLSVDLVRHEVKRGDREIELSQREFALLEYLMRSPGRVYSRSQICEHVWNTHFDTGTNMVDVAITRLRKKLEEPAESKLIDTIRGVGYRFKESS